MSAPVEHKLVDDTLVVTDDGVVARCTCGWNSGPRFSGMIASVHFMSHQEEQANKEKSK